MTIAPPIPDLQSAVLQAIKNGAQPVQTTLHVPSMQQLDEGTLGDFPWYWQLGTNFNAKTFQWLNNVFAYNATDNYVGTSAENFLTQYYNVLSDTRYVLNSADAGALNAAILANASVVNSVITDWTTTQGAFPSTTPTTQSGQLTYIMTQVLTWGAPGLTLGTLRNSTNPMALLPNIPVGGDQLVEDLMTYLANTSSVANIQASVVSANNELAQIRANVTPAPSSLGPGWMQIVDDSGVTQIVPSWNIVESTATIQNNLLPATGTGLTFSTTLSASKESSSQVHISAEGGIAGFGEILDLIGIFGEANASYNLWSFDESVTNVDIGLQFNGVTTVTPVPASYDVATGHGWWSPAPIQSAVNYVPSQSGYEFTPNPGLNFGVNGNFGTPSRLVISQQPTMTLTFYTTNYSSFSQVITEDSRWGISFLGIPLAGGSQSYFNAKTSQNEEGGTVTVTMTPVGNTTPVTPADQLAYVIGVEVLWPGATQ